MQGTYLITGGEGFIGRNIKQYLMKNSCNALTLDIHGKPDFMISVTDFPSLMDIDEEFDGIFHLAATTSPPQFEDDPLGGFNVNANGTLNILEYAKRKKDKESGACILIRNIRQFWKHIKGGDHPPDLFKSLSHN